MPNSRVSLFLVASSLALGCGSTTHVSGDRAGGAAGRESAAGAGGEGGAGDGGAAAVEPRRICDGTDAIRLAVRTLVDSTRVRAFKQALYELGTSFLYVDGRCRYWVQDPNEDSFRPWRAYHHGTLTESQEQRLHAAVSYDDVTKGPPCVGPFATDGSPTSVWDGKNTVICAGQVQAEFDWPMRAELFSEGTELAGAVRVEVGQDSVPPKAKIYDWPLIDPPSYYETDYGEASENGHSKLVDDAGEASAVRAFREQVLADVTKTPESPFDIVFVSPQGYVMSFRDDLPFTNRVDGLWLAP